MEWKLDVELELTRREGGNGKIRTVVRYASLLCSGDLKVIGHASLI